MRILVWSPNYAPEPIGIPPLVTDAAEWLTAHGHEVEVVTAVPNYPERRIHTGFSRGLWFSDEENGVRVLRSWLRVRPGENLVDKALYEASFAALSAPRVAHRLRQANLIVCLVPTLFSAATGAWAARVAGIPCVVWVQDLVLLAARSVKGGDGRGFRILRRVESAAVRRASRVITCSPGFVDYLTAAGASPGRVTVVPNWVDVSRIAAAPEPVAPNPFAVLYTGNIGYTQGFETALAAARLAGPGVHLQLVGGGNAYDHVRSIASGNASLRPAVQDEAYPSLLAGAHAFLVLQRRVAANVNLPSKIATYLAAGRPVIASIASDTPAAELLRESGAAVLVPPEQPGALACAIRDLADDPVRRRQLGAAGRAYAKQHLDREVVLPRLEAALREAVR